jgi:hypothetical protein
MLLTVTRMLFVAKYPFSTIETLIDLDRVISHKKYQMMNQIAFSKVGSSHQILKKKLEKNEVSIKIA